jgi:Tfp pilus assembly protein PilO
MRLSTRELSLAWVTTVVIVVGLTYWFGRTKAQGWRSAGQAREALAIRKRTAEHLLKDQDQVNARLEVLRKQLPQYPASKDVTAEILMTIERTAQQHGLILLRRVPEKEKSVGDLYEVAIDCSWEGELDAITHFLYALQVQGAILDVSQLTMSPGQGGPGRLKGTFTANYAYTRATAGLDSVQTQPEPAK